MKNNLRKIALAKRKSLDISLLSEKIIKNLFSLDEYINSKNILTYYPLKYEVSTLACFNDADKNWFLPRVNGSMLDICPYNKQKMSLGAYKIMEPQTEKICDYSILDMAIIPAAAVDVQGYRIGYGKGYYDRLFKQLPSKVIKVALCPIELLFDSIYPDSYDEPVDIIVTENQILKTVK